eukprot:TRINITY_DN3260_c0_g1_i1.p1 TRINITY_DN3260_c0_g1~~TRINITY_DN3260_c0_g1_i1.p1  ORF type:complete len:269 (-),score=26.26 TRINITY_DN3260_c0_g1_i1:1024-1830(-)
MKLQCDACEKATASVLCCADEAVLCSRCDISIHKANKLASKHKRLSLIGSSPKLSRCDICQDKPAFVFCLEDRALLCRDCDESVHSPNTLASKHQRFLATGIRLAVQNQEADVSPDNSSHLTPGKNLSTSKDQDFDAKLSSPSYSEPSWTVEELLRLTELPSKGATDNMESFDWDMNDFDPLRMLEKDESQLARVPQMSPAISGGGVNSFGANKAYSSSVAKAKPKIDNMDSTVPALEFDDTAFIVPDIESLNRDFLSTSSKRFRRSA